MAWRQNSVKTVGSLLITFYSMSCFNYMYTENNYTCPNCTCFLGLDINDTLLSYVFSSFACRISYLILGGKRHVNLLSSTRDCPIVNYCYSNLVRKQQT